MRAPAPQRRPGWLGATVAMLVVMGCLIALGTWQLQRKAWKENLIATLDRRLAAAPVEMPPAAQWPSLEEETDEFRRVTLRASFLPGQEALVYTSGSALRTDVSGLGYWVFAPARRDDGSTIVVNRGFVPDGRQDPRSRPQGELTGPIDLVGVLRWAEPATWFTPAPDLGKGLWFQRDPQVMAAAKGWGADAPFYIDLESPVPPGGLPIPGPLRVNLRNEHLQYAITWYGLAAVLAVVFGLWLVRRRREAA